VEPLERRELLSASDIVSLMMLEHKSLMTNLLIRVGYLAMLKRPIDDTVAEVVKYGAIRSPELFAWLESNVELLRGRDDAALTQAIHESCRIKAEIVAADERETGERTLLNFGHTFGHAIEVGTGYGTWLHGEAVAAGMVLAGELSVRVTGMPPTENERLRRLLSRFGLPVDPPALGCDRYLELMARDKKVDRKLRLVPLRCWDGRRSVPMSRSRPASGAGPLARVAEKHGAEGAAFSRRRAALLGRRAQLPLASSSERLAR
jgi:hypothetical protein